MPSTEAGHHEKRVYLHQDGRLVVPSSASILIEGSTSTFKNSGARIIDRNIGFTTSRTTEVTGGNLSNDGITVIISTGVGLLKLAAPTKGAEKTIIWGSTAAIKVKVRVSQTVDDASIKVGGFPGKVNPNLGANCFYASSDAFKNQFKAAKYGLGPSITLVGWSTARWFVKSYTPSNTTGAAVPWIFATSTAG